MSQPSQVRNRQVQRLNNALDVSNCTCKTAEAQTLKQNKFAKLLRAKFDLILIQAKANNAAKCLEEVWSLILKE